MAALNHNSYMNNILTVNQFNSNFANYDFLFSCFNLNIASLNKHHEDLQTLLSDVEVSFDMINLCEIRDVNLENFHNIFPQYSFVYKKPIGKMTGGVGMYLNNKLDFLVLDDYALNTPLIDTLSVKINFTRQRPIIICNIYRHHSISIREFIDHFKVLMKKLESINAPIVLVGDFNINLLLTDVKDVKDFYEETLFNGYTQAIDTFTRVTQNSASLIDHIYYKNISKCDLITGTLQTDISDHFSTFLMIKGNKVLNKKETIKKPVYSEKNIKKFNSKLPISIFNILQCISFGLFDSETYWKFFIDTIKQLINDSFPTLKLSRSQQRNKVWMNAEIKKECRLKENLYKKYINNRTDYRREKYLDQKRKVNNIISHAKKNYYEKYFDNNISNKNLWKFISSFKSTPNEINKILYCDTVVTKPIEIANCFNNYFSTIGSTLASKINSSTDFEAYINNPKNIQFFMRHSNSIEIKEIIGSLKNTNSVGIDNIPMKLLKVNSDLFSLVLSRLINISISDSCFPSVFKVAKIIPLHKKGSKTETSNYRPIAILSNVSKVFEKFIYIRLSEYFQINNIIYEHQFGFRKFHNTTHAILSVNDLICKSICNKDYLLGIFLDLSKAFDTVNNEILCKKLVFYGIKNKELLLIKSFLSNRVQITFTNECFSEPLGIEIGVPQGSILSPLLFLIYVNDIQYFVTKNISIKLFADDTNVFIKSNSLDDLFNQSNCFLNRLNTWFKSNKLSLNLDKTEYLVFGNPRLKESHNLFLESRKINKVRCTKYLGLQLNDKLRWNETITHILKKTNRYKFIFNKLKQFLSKRKLIILYKALILSNISYGIEVYGNCPDYLLTKLQRLQNYFLKLIQKCVRRYDTRKLHKELNMLLIKDLYRFKLCLLIFDIKHTNEKSSYLKQFKLTKRSETHCYNTRNSNMLVIEKTKKDTIENISKKEYNSLPSVITEIDNRNKFKFALHNYFASKY